MKQSKTALLATLAVLGASSSASADILTFDKTDACSPTEASCADNDLIDQSYGDGVGVDFAWGDVSLGNRPGMQFWGAWGSTTDAIFAGDNNSQSKGRIDIIALSGYSITLNGFDLAAFQSGLQSKWNIRDLAGGILASSGGLIDISFPGLTSVVTNFSSTTGFRITWGPSAYDVGLDNLNYDVTAVSVPEPGTLLLFGLGLAALGLKGRKKKV